VRDIALASVAGSTLGLATFLSDAWLRFGRLPIGDLPAVGGLALLTAVFIALGALPLLAGANHLESVAARWVVGTASGALGGYVVVLLFVAGVLRRPVAMVLADWRGALPFVACGVGVAAAWLLIRTPPNSALNRTRGTAPRAG
jgi:hypothetical protein